MSPEEAERKRHQLELQRDSLVAFRDQKEFKQFQLHVQEEVDGLLDVLLNLPVNQLGDVAVLMETRGKIKGLMSLKSTVDEATEALNQEINKL